MLKKAPFSEYFRTRMLTHIVNVAPRAEGAVHIHLYHCNATLPIPFHPRQKHCYILDLKLCLQSFFL